MAVRQTDLAAKWGLSKAAVSKLVTRGMPLESEESAMRWRLMNRKGQQLQGNNVPQPTPVAAPVDPQAATNDSLEKEEVFSDESTYRRCQQAEVAAFNAMANCLRPNSVTADQFKTMLGAHSAAVSAKIRAEKQIKDKALASKTLIYYDDARAEVMPLLLTMRAIVDGLAATCGPRCNPSDPQFAILILDEWVEHQFLKVLSHGELTVLAPKES